MFNYYWYLKDVKICEQALRKNYSGRLRYGARGTDDGGNVKVLPWGKCSSQTCRRNLYDLLRFSLKFLGYRVLERTSAIWFGSKTLVLQHGFAFDKFGEIVWVVSQCYL